MKKPTVSELETIARELRIDIVTTVHNAGCGHTGGPLSCIDLLTALYFYKMSIRVDDPTWADRDRFVLSVGHVNPALYVVLSRLGFFPKAELSRLRKLGSELQGHPKMKVKWGIEMSTGSLGQGMSIANGMALAARMDGRPSRIYSLESDGGSQEGMMWEGAMTAAHYKLDNRCSLLDFNNVQIDGYVENVKGVAPLEDKFKSFGWHVISIDGHNMQQIVNALDEAETIKGKPTMIVAHTVLGKGVSIFENKPKYHGVSPTDDELKVALKELGAL